jgi:hypothetical protein
MLVYSSYDGVSFWLLHTYRDQCEMEGWRVFRAEKIPRIMATMRMEPNVPAKRAYYIMPCRSSKYNIRDYNLRIFLSDDGINNYDSLVWLFIVSKTKKTPWPESASELYRPSNRRWLFIAYKTKRKLRGLSPRANYTDRATAACRRS